MTWGKLSMLVAVAGEIIAASSSFSEERPEEQEEAMKMCIAFADELCHPMLHLGTWDDFCRYVKKQHSLVFYGHKIGRSPNLSLKRRIANAVKVLEKAIFFQ